MSRMLSTREGCGRGDWIRTSDPLHPMQVRYRAAPRPEESLEDAHHQKAVSAPTVGEE